MTDDPRANPGQIDGERKAPASAALLNVNTLAGEQAENCPNGNHQKVSDDAIVRLTRALVRWTAGLAVATIALGVIAFLQFLELRSTDKNIGRQAKTTEEQLAVMQGQLSAMEADQRPWLRVITQIREPISITEWSGTKGITVPLRFNIENFGKAPAVNVRAYMTITPYLGVEHGKILAGLQRDTCEKGISESDQDPNGGIPIFPTKADKIEITPGVIGGGIFLDGKPVMLAVYGCIDYTYSGTKHGQTGFRLLLGKRDGVRFSGFQFVEGQPVPSDQPIPEELLKSGFPKDPSKVAKIPLEELIFRPEDSGNYAK